LAAYLNRYPRGLSSEETIALLDLGRTARNSASAATFAEQ
jgi:hypothetical protein